MKVTLSEVTTLTPGFAFKSKDFKNGNMPVLKIADIQGQVRCSNVSKVNTDAYTHAKLEKYLVKPGDCLVAMTGNTIGKIGRVSEGTGLINQRVLKINPADNKILDSEYLWGLLQLNSFHRHIINHIDSHSAQPNISASSIGKFSFDLPELNTQIKISKILASIRKKAELNNRINDYLSEIGGALFSHEILESIDDTWLRASLLDIASYKNGLAMQKYRPEKDDPGLPVLKIKELAQGQCAADAERCRSDIDESVKIFDGDLIFSWSGTLLLDFWAGGNAGLNQHLFKVTSKKYKQWFYYFWTNYHMRKFITLAKDRATTMGHIKRSALAESEVYIPNENKMNELDKLFDPLIKKIISLKIESRILSELRNELLPKLMSGEIDVCKVGVLVERL